MKTVPLEDLIACGATVARTVVHDHTGLSCSCTAVTWLESRAFVEVSPPVRDAFFLRIFQPTNRPSRR